MASLSLHPGKASPGCPRLSETGRRPAELAAASKTLRVSSHARTVLGRNPGCFGFVSAGSKAWPFTTPVLGGTIQGTCAGRRSNRRPPRSAREGVVEEIASLIAFAASPCDAVPSSRMHGRRAADRQPPGLLLQWRVMRSAWHESATRTRSSPETPACIRSSARFKAWRFLRRLPRELIEATPDHCRGRGVRDDAGITLFGD